MEDIPVITFKYTVIAADDNGGDTIFSAVTLMTVDAQTGFRFEASVCVVPAEVTGLVRHNASMRRTNFMVISISWHFPACTNEPD